MADITTDELWDELRLRCCATKPHTDAKTIVMLRRDDLDVALRSVIGRTKRYVLGTVEGFARKQLARIS